MLINYFSDCLRKKLYRDIFVLNYYFVLLVDLDTENII